MELKVTYETCELHRVNFSVDLDSLYKTPSGDFVYALDKVEVDERNVWQLVINVTLTGGFTASFKSKGFRIRTKPRAAKHDGQKNGTNNLISYYGCRIKSRKSKLSYEAQTTFLRQSELLEMKSLRLTEVRAV